MKEVITEISSDGNYMTLRFSKVYLLYFTIEVAASLIFFMIVNAQEASSLAKFVFQAASLFILINSFRHFKKLKSGFLFDKLHKVIKAGVNPEIPIDNIRYLRMTYDKSKPDVNECLLKLIFLDEEILIHKTDASNHKKAKALGLKIADFIDKPLKKPDPPDFKNL